METQHINRDLLKKYHANLLSTEENRRLLEHTGKCICCADLFAASFTENNGLMPAPKNLKNGILLEASRKKELFARRQWFFYSMRVCTAMCGALFLLFSSTWKDAAISPADNISSSSQMDSILNNVQESMDSFTIQLHEKINAFFADTNNK